MSKKFLWLFPLGLVVALIGIGKLVSAQSLVMPALADEKVVTTVVDTSDSTTTFTWPIEPHFVMRGLEFGHTGIDIVTDQNKVKATEGIDVLAAQTGVIKFAGWNSAGYGNLVIIGDENGFETYYGHLSEITVKAGGQIAQGEIIGKAGHTGRATGSHVHFEVRKNKKILNPMNYLSEDQTVTQLDSVLQRPQVSESGYIWPTTAWMIVRGLRFGHTGIDITTNNGTAFGRPVFAAQSGTTTFVGWSKDDGSGNLVVIDHGDGYETRYAHLSQIFVTVGQAVEKGQNLGAIGSTGRSTGPHLHFEMRYNGKILNPLDYVRPPTDTVK